MNPNRNDAGGGANGGLRDLFVRAAREILDGTEINLDLRKVAERAGKSRTAPYLAFGKSEEGGGLPALQMAVAADGFNSLVEQLRRARARSPNPEEALEAVASVYLSFARAHPRLFRHMFDPQLGPLLLVEAHCEPAVREQVGLRRARGRLEDTFTRLAGMQRSWYLKEAEELDPATVGAALWGMIHGVAVLTIDRQWELGALGRGSAQVQAERVLRFLTTASYRSIREVARELDLARKVQGTHAREEPLGEPVDRELLDQVKLKEDRRPTSRAREEIRRRGYVSSEVPSRPELEDANAELFDTLPEGGEDPERRQRLFIQRLPSKEERKSATTPPETLKAAPRGSPSARSRSPRIAASSPPPPGSPPRAGSLEASEEALSSPALRRAVTLGSRLRGQRVLWIEDRPHRVRHERLVLEKLGMEIRMVETSQEAFEALDRGQPDLIFSDVRREGTDDEGIRVLPALLAMAARTPVIYYDPPAPTPTPTPTGAFGLTGDPDEFLHLVVDAVDRG